MRGLVALLTAVGAAGVLVLSVPLLAGSYPVAQVVSFRTIVALALAGAGGLLLAVPWLRARALPIAVVLLVGALVQVAVLASRSWPRQTGGSGDLTVLTYNVQWDSVPAQRIAALATRERADVVVLPETSSATVQQVASLLGADGWAWWYATGSRPADGGGTGVLIADSVGSYAEGPQLPTAHGSIVLTPTSGAGPTIVAAHPVAPSSVGQMAQWRDETSRVVAVCRDTPDVVLAGDLNSTLDHPALSAASPCVDAATQAGRGAVGTWPTSRPAWLGAPIDHVLADGRRWRVVAVSVLDESGSDHRPLVARLARR